MSSDDPFASSTPRDETGAALAPSSSNGANASGANASGASVAALLAAKRFKSNAASASQRAAKAAVGARLRAELPPGPLPDESPVSFSKKLARMRSKDGMTPGDRAKKEAKLRELEAALDAEASLADAGDEQNAAPVVDPVDFDASPRTPDPPAPDPPAPAADDEDDASETRASPKMNAHLDALAHDEASAREASVRSVTDERAAAAANLIAKARARARGGGGETRARGGGSRRSSRERRGSRRPPPRRGSRRRRGCTRRGCRGYRDGASTREGGGGEKTSETRGGGETTRDERRDGW